MSITSTRRLACLRPSHIYRVVSSSQVDVSDCFEPKDLQDSMDYFWIQYDINVWQSNLDNQHKMLTANDRGHAYLDLSYLQSMTTFRTEADKSKSKYLHALNHGMLGSYSEFIEETDPENYESERKYRPIFFTDQGTMRSTRTVVTRIFKKEMLHIFERMMKLHTNQHSTTTRTDVAGSHCRVCSGQYQF